MSDFEKWWIDLTFVVAEKIGIFLLVSDMDKFRKYFDAGLATKRSYAKTLWSSLSTLKSPVYKIKRITT